MIELVSNGARDREVPAIVGQQKEHTGAGTQPMQGLVNGRRNRVCGRRWRDRTPHLICARRWDCAAARSAATRADRSRLIVLSTQAPSSAARVQTAMKAASCGSERETCGWKASILPSQARVV